MIFDTGFLNETINEVFFGFFSQIQGKYLAWIKAGKNQNVVINWSNYNKYKLNFTNTKRKYKKILKWKIILKHVVYFVLNILA